MPEIRWGMRFLTLLIVIALFYMFYIRPRSKPTAGAGHPTADLATAQAAQPAAPPASPAPPAQSSFLKRPFDRTHDAINAVQKSRE